MRTVSVTEAASKTVTWAANFASTTLKGASSTGTARFFVPIAGRQIRQVEQKLRLEI
jgi:hypothetical protein